MIMPKVARRDDRCQTVTAAGSSSTDLDRAVELATSK